MNKKMTTIMVNYMLEKDLWEKVMRADKKLSPLLSQLDIKNYSNNFLSIWVIFIILSDEAMPRKERMSISRKNQSAEIHHIIDFKSIESADDAQVLEILKKNYLSSLRKFLPKCKDINAEKFCADVEAVLG